MPDGQDVREARPAGEKSDRSPPDNETGARPPDRFLSLEDLRGFQEPPWLIKRFLASDSVAAIYGPPGSYKSFLALSIGLSIANQKDFAGRPVAHPEPVAYVAGEGSIPGFCKRWEAWNRHFGGSESAPLRYLRSQLILSEKSDLKKLIELLDDARDKIGKPFRLVIVDTLARAFGQGDENSAKDMNLFLDGCQDLCQDQKLAMLLVAHSGKKEAKGIRGSLALSAALDSIFFAKKKGMSVALRVDKQKDIESGGAFHFNLQSVSLDDDSTSLVPVFLTHNAVEEEDEKHKTSPARTKAEDIELRDANVLAIYKEAGDGGCKTSEAKKSACDRYKMSGATFNRARTSLSEKNMVIRLKRGVWAIRLPQADELLADAQSSPQGTC